MNSRWVHQAPLSTAFDKFTKKDLDYMLHFAPLQTIESAMEPFWRSLSECKLMPLTTDYHPADKELKNKQLYHNDHSTVNVTKTGFIKRSEDYLTEYICLRLTQNF